MPDDAVYYPEELEESQKRILLPPSSLPSPLRRSPDKLSLKMPWSPNADAGNQKEAQGSAIMAAIDEDCREERQESTEIGKYPAI